MSCVIVADGRFPRKKSTLKYIDEAETIIACDGACKKLIKYGRIPKFIIGDMDSLDENIKLQYSDRIHRLSDQETNDLTKAVEFARSKGEKSVIILGATGLREDHTLGNISLLAQYNPVFEDIKIVSDYGCFIVMKNKTETFESKPGKQISIFSIDNKNKITTCGLKYPISERALNSWWQGTLNECEGYSFSIKANKPESVLIYFER